MQLPMSFTSFAPEGQKRMAALMLAAYALQAMIQLDQGLPCSIRCSNGIDKGALSFELVLSYLVGELLE